MVDGVNPLVTYSLHKSRKGERLGLPIQEALSPRQKKWQETSLFSELAEAPVVSSENSVTSKFLQPTYVPSSPISGRDQY